MRYVLLCTLLLGLSCTRGEASEDASMDVAVVRIQRPATPPPACVPDQVSTDLYHCGQCDNACPPADADRCVEGRCQCGLRSPCVGNTDCRRGTCLEPDLEGKYCEFDDECTANEGCIVGHCTFVSCVPEVCDGVDNDCDGVVDNAGVGPLSRFCVGGEPAGPEEPLSPCQRGVQACQQGTWTVCTGDIQPREEVGLYGCDGIDNNCDGCVDGVYEDGTCITQEPVAFDVLFLLDISGSMSGEIEVVRQAVRLFSSRLSTNPMLRWGIVTIPGIVDGVPDLHQDLTGFSTFTSALDTMPAARGGSEPQWDAIIQSVDGTLGVSWRQNAARIIILFTDEPGQSVASPPADEASMCAALTAGEVFISVTEIYDFEDFDDCAHASILLETGRPGTGASCFSTSDCPAENTCESAVCVSEAVLNTTESLGNLITNPCGD